MQGRVKYFNKDKGFGFIIGKDNEDYFYHVSQVKDYSLVEIGDTVDFEPSQNGKGKCALNIKVIKKSVGRVKTTHKTVTVRHINEDRSNGAWGLKPISFGGNR